MVALLLALTTSVSGCRATVSTTVPLLKAAGIPITFTPTGAIPLEVVTHTVGTEVPDPLPVNGTTVAYSDLEQALGHAVSSACVPWAKEHREVRPEGWQLQVDIVAANAEHSDGRLTMTLSVRATLRARAGNEYLAQTDVHCLESGRVAAGEGASVIYTCMTRLGRDLAGWLGGLEP